MGLKLPAELKIVFLPNFAVNTNRDIELFSDWVRWQRALRACSRKEPHGTRKVSVVAFPLFL